MDLNPKLSSGNAIVIAGDGQAAESGDQGIAIAGKDGTAKAGRDGVVGDACDVVDIQDGLECNTEYRLNECREFVPVSSSGSV